MNDIAQEIWEAMIDELFDREGFDQWWDNASKTDQDEMAASVKSRIDRAIQENFLRVN